MLQIVLSLLRRASDLAPSHAESGRSAGCVSDPLSHPALKAMRPDELADIPFPRPIRNGVGRR